MDAFFKSLGAAVKDTFTRLSYWQILLLVAVLIFAAAAAKHYFP